MSLKDVLQPLGRIKDICITLVKDCGENALEQSSKLYCVVKNYQKQNKSNNKVENTTMLNVTPIFTTIWSLEFAVDIPFRSTIA